MCVDLLVVWMLINIPSLILWWTLEIPPPYRVMSPDYSYKQFIRGKYLMMCCSFIPLLYFSIMHKIRGYSIGKLIGGCRVVSTDGRGITWGRSILRALLYKGFLTLFICMRHYPDLQVFGNWLRNILVITAGYFVFDCAMALCHRSRRSVHDYLSSTMVVNTRGAPSLCRRVIMLVLTAGHFLLVYMIHQPMNHSLDDIGEILRAYILRYLISYE